MVLFDFKKMEEVKAMSFKKFCLMVGVLTIFAGGLFVGKKIYDKKVH